MWVDDLELALLVQPAEQREVFEQTFEELIRLGLALGKKFTLDEGYAVHIFKEVYGI